MTEPNLVRLAKREDSGFLGHILVSFGCLPVMGNGKNEIISLLLLKILLKKRKCDFFAKFSKSN